MHRVLTEGFSDHWAFEPLPFDDWLALETSAAGYDPALWVLAEITGSPAAVMLLSRRSDAERGLYVQELTTLRPHRHRGVASALLRHAFDVARAEGYDHVDLHVDSQSSDGAPDIYRRAGFEVRHSFNACVLRLVPAGPAPS